MYSWENKGCRQTQKGLDVGQQLKPEQGRVGQGVGCCTFRKPPSGSSCSCLDSSVLSLCERCLRTVDPPSTVLDRRDTP